MNMILQYGTQYNCSLFDMERQERFSFVHSSDGQIHGVYIYVSLLTACFVQYAQVFVPGTRRVCCFKRFGSGRCWVKNVVRQAKFEFRCESIFVAPGSTPSETQLQLLFGAKIRRISPVFRRKGNNKCEIESDYRESLSLRDDCPRKVLLVDDVCTTGRTLNWFKDYLTGYGYEVVMFCLGMNHRLVSDRTTACFLKMAEGNGNLYENHKDKDMKIA